MKRDENIELFCEVDESIKQAMGSMGAELRKYLIEAEKKIPQDNKAVVTPPKQSIFEPFAALFDISWLKGKDKKKGDSLTELELTAEKKKAKSGAEKDMWNMYKEYKKAYKMMTW